MVSVSGSGSTWTSSWNLSVGNSGGGTLSIANGGGVSVSSSFGYSYIGNYAGSTGVVTVDGAGSALTSGEYLYIGNSGSGTLSITNGGSVSVGNSYIGNYAGSTGVVMVDGTGSTWSSGGLTVGGNGRLSITNGGSVSSGDGYIGGAVTVSGAGSTWMSGSSFLFVNGTLSITNGGSASNGDCYIGSSSGSTAVVTVDGTGSMWTSHSSSVNTDDRLFVGYYPGGGALSITNGASVSVVGETFVGANTGYTGVIDFGTNGGTLTTQTLLASPAQLAGTGTINTNGLVSDIDLRFDSAHGLKQTLVFQQSGQNVTVNVDMTGGAGAYGALGAGWQGAGSLTIQDGINISGYNGYLGYGSTAMGVATVAGPGSTWNSTFLYVGNGGSGTLSITNGGSVNSYYDYLGYNSGSRGVATVTGTGSTWTCSSLVVGNSGSGTLSITNGGSVSVSGATQVGANNGSTGTIDFGANGGTLTTQTLLVSPAQLAGTGTINTNGLVSDIDLRFDSTHGPKQVFVFQQPSQNVTVKLDMTTTQGALGAGWIGAGSLEIQDGVKVTSGSGYLGYNSGSTGVATVKGTGSTWTNSNGLSVGCYGGGTLSIASGGSVNGFGYIGVNSGSTGVVTVDGTGSTWTNNTSRTIQVGYNGGGTLSILNGGRVISWGGSSIGSTGMVMVDGTGSTWTNRSSLSVGSTGGGTLSITGGGTVTATSVTLGSGSLLAIDVGCGSLLSVGGTGTFTNEWLSTIRFLAGAGVAANTKYLPIPVPGGYPMQAVGGTWDWFTAKFTASSVTSGTSGTPVSLDLASVQRVLVSDNGTGGTGWEVGASFLAQPTSTPLNFTATAMNSDTLTALRGLLAPGRSVLSGWDFSADAGYTPGDPAYLSFGIGSGYSSEGLEVWHYDGSNWTEFAANDLTYDGTYASFTVTGFSGYAMVAVPEPGTLALLAAGLFSLLAYAWRRRV